jgi:type IV pilus assembly protein PilY1
MRTDNDAPIQYECQKNFTLLFTDGYNSQTSGSVGNSDGTAGAPYQDSESNTIADIAHHFYSTPLRTGTNFPAGKVVPPDECSDTENPLDPKMDCNTNLHMNTYMVGLGAKGTIYGNSVAGHTYLKVKDAYDAPPTWPGMGDRNPTQVDDLYHAAINGRGEMFNASTPALLGDALSSALKEIIESIGSSSSIAFTRGPDFTTGVGARAYPTLFDSKDWSGNLYAYTLDANGDLDALLWRDENGEAVGVQELLDQRVLSGETARNILTMGVNGGVAFEWDNLTTAQKADLKTNSDGSTGTDSDGDARLDYLRGDMTVEGINLDTANEEKFRVRSHRLGDIMNSSPVFVGEPNARWPNKGKFGVDGDRYFDFQRTKADRSQMVYVGANDGMLHGFNAEAYDASSNPDAGQEVFAYIPSMAYSSETKEGLHYLTSSEYNHRAYVNMPSVVSDVHIYTDQVIVPDSTSRSWRTVLIGGMGNGGKGIFALDVTEPDNISESDQEARDTVLWEFSSDNIAAADQDDFGYLNGQPEIVMMNNGKWAAVFGNGYNSDAEKAKLFIVYIEQGIDGAWSTGDYQVLDTNNETSNGLSMALPYDSDGDMVVDRIYAGDLQGNMWVFDVSSDNSTNWGSAYRNSGINIPLFTATDASNKRQPITAAPRLAKHDSMPDLNNGENILVTFGTGSYVFEGDDSDQSVQTYYTIWDNSESQDTTVTKAKLAERTKSIARVVNDEPLFTSTGTPINWASDLGWYMDFTVSGVAKGERLDTSPLLGVDLNGEPIAVFSSIQPEDSACAKGGGDGFIYNVSLLDGFTPDAPVIDLDGDGDIDSSDNVLGKQSQTMLNELTTFGKNIYGSSRTSSDVFKLKSNLGGEIREGRMGWYEL